MAKLIILASETDADICDWVRIGNIIKLDVGILFPFFLKIHNLLSHVLAAIQKLYFKNGAVIPDLVIVRSTPPTCSVNRRKHYAAHWACAGTGRDIFTSLELKLRITRNTNQDTNTNDGGLFHFSIFLFC